MSEQMPGMVDENEAMKALMGIVQNTDQDTVRRVQNYGYTDRAQLHRAMHGGGDFAEDDTTLDRNNLKSFLKAEHDYNASRAPTAREMAEAAAIAKNAGESFAGFVPDNEFPRQPQMQPQYQPGMIPYAPPQFPAQPAQPQVQNIKMPEPATKAIVDSLAYIANNLPPALRGLYLKQEELLKEVKRTNELFVAFLRAYASQNKPAIKVKDEEKPVEETDSEVQEG